jgi:hypothetical protein
MTESERLARLRALHAQMLILLGEIGDIAALWPRDAPAAESYVAMIRAHASMSESSRWLESASMHLLREEQG